MQNKGFVKFLAIALTLVCLFYMSFSVVTSIVDNKAASMTESEAEAYLDSLETNSFYLGKNLKECRENAIGLGLDLKGGMNVMIEVSVPDIVKVLSDRNSDPEFNKVIDLAQQENINSQDDYMTCFMRVFKQQLPDKNLAQFFATQKLSDSGVTSNSTDAEIEKVLRDEIDAAVDNTFLVLRTRIDRFGVVQPNIQKVEGETGRILVELPGIKEPERVRKLLQGSANLEFWETYDSEIAVKYLTTLNNSLRSATVAESDSVANAPADSTQVEETTKEEVAEVADSAKDSVKTDDNLIAKVSNTDKKENGKLDEKEIAKLKAENPLFSILQPVDTRQGGHGCVVGYVAVSDTAEVNKLLASEVAKRVLPVDMSLKWGVKGIDKANKLFELYAIRTTGVNGRAPLEGDVVTDASSTFDELNNPCVSMKMNSEGARKWANLTEKNINHAIAIVLDGLVYSAPNVNNKIDGGSSQITGHFDVNDTKDLANVLKSGKMPAPTQIVQEDIVGPSLGAESIKAGIISFIIALIALWTYMCCIYGFRAGMVANTALLLNFFFTVGILTSLQAALTMSGIAGMVLTLGMAVDANVLIFERTKEELKAGKNIRSAIDAGYSNAFSAIFDSNLTSIITGVILFYFGTGPIKGFATTLIIGIICSFFTAVWLTRIWFEHQMKHDKWTDLTFTTKMSKNMMQGTDYKFMSVYKISYTIFGVALLISIISFCTRGLSQSIDFTGGRNYKVEFITPVVPEDVEAALDAKFQAKVSADENTDKATVQVIAVGTDNKTIRVSTNYRINENGENVDSEIEAVLYNTFVENGWLDKSVTLEHFIDRDNREGGSIISSQKVGASIAEDITYGAIWSVILALIAIFLYILLRFRNVAFSIGSIVALACDTFLIIGIYSLCWGWIGFSLEIDQTFIGAILTCIGYSINDKVVIFDRIREELRLYPNRERQRLFNDSLNVTLARTINTSVSTFIVLLAIFIIAGESIRSFAFAMILGVVIGTCSSLFVAAPTAYLVLGKKIVDRRVKADAAPAEETK